MIPAPVYPNFTQIPYTVSCSLPSTFVTAVNANGQSYSGIIDGEWDAATNTIYLRPNLCRSIKLAEKSELRTPREEMAAAEATLIVGHELGHASGIPETPADGDSAANCYGVTHFWQTATLLRIPLRNLEGMWWLIANTFCPSALDGQP